MMRTSDLEPGLRSISYLHSNQETIHVLTSDEQLQTINLSHKTTTLVTLEKIKTWKEVFWSGLELAITQPVYSKNFAGLDSQSNGFTTTIFHTLTGEKLTECKNENLSPIGWLPNKTLLMKDVGREIKNLFLWNTQKIKTICKAYSFANRPVSQIICQEENEGEIYSLDAWDEKPFSKLDLHQQKLVPLGYSRLGHHHVRNLGIADRKNIFFSKERSFVLLNDEVSQANVEIRLPTEPISIQVQQPFVAYYEGSMFFLYDLRRTSQCLLEHDYASLSTKIRNSFMGIFSSITKEEKPFITSMTFHDKGLFVGKRDGSIDYLDLESCQLIKAFDFA